MYQQGTLQTHDEHSQSEIVGIELGWHIRNDEHWVGLA